MLTHGTGVLGSIKVCDVARGIADAHGTRHPYYSHVQGSREQDGEEGSQRNGSAWIFQVSGDIRPGHDAGAIGKEHGEDANEIVASKIRSEI